MLRKFALAFACLTAWSLFGQQLVNDCNSCIVVAQTTSHSAVLTWVAPSDAVAGSAYNLYRASGACPASGLGTLTFTKVNAAPIAALTYTDSTIGVGQWCYYVTQEQNNVESNPSNTAGGLARPNTVSIQIVIQ